MKRGMNLTRILQIIEMAPMSATSAYTFEPPATVILDGIAYKPMDSQRHAITGSLICSRRLALRYNSPPRWAWNRTKPFSSPGHTLPKKNTSAFTK